MAEHSVQRSEREGEGSTVIGRREERRVEGLENLMMDLKEIVKCNDDVEVE
jgi:hypothetical protein